MAKVKISNGVRFDRWLVVSRGLDYLSPTGKSRAVRWNCVCDCGNEGLVHAAHLRNETSKSCGCLKVEVCSTHKLTKTRAFSAWCSMRARCENLREKDFVHYKGKGISYPPEWETMEGFFNDMGECPDGYELERLDGSLGYSAENCIWASGFTQSQNRKTFKNNTSGRTGVVWSNQHQKWRVILFHNNIKYEGGLFDSFDSAVSCREKLEVTHLGKIKTV